MQLFLNKGHERIVLNGQSLKWCLVEACVLKGSHLDLIYITDLSQGLRCNAKLFGGNILFFSTIPIPVILSSNLNEKLLKLHIGFNNGECCLIQILKKSTRNCFFLKEK